MPWPFLVFSQADYLVLIVAINSQTYWQTMQIQISWLLQKPTDLDLHSLQRQGISGFSRTRINKSASNEYKHYIYVCLMEKKEKYKCLNGHGCWGRWGTPYQELCTLLDFWFDMQLDHFDLVSSLQPPRHLLAQLLVNTCSSFHGIGGYATWPCLEKV